MTKEDTTPLAVSKQYSKWSRRCIFALYGNSVGWGISEVLFPDSSTTYLIFGVLFALSATLWARFDALARSKPILPVLQMLYLLAWPVGAAIYLAIRSGWRGLGIGFLTAIGLYATIALSLTITMYIMHYMGALDPRFYQTP